ncbi:MAG: hypothetical protein Q8Q07_05850 [Dehalococcoidales bacterium]|nr:hypothetical protein [Dehalococcoidales bacterium]
MVWQVKNALVLVLLVILGLLPGGCAGNSGEVKAALGQQFSLSPGQSAVITGEELKIKFEGVLEDSRCPRNVVCIWEGRVRYVVQVTADGSLARVELTEPGLTDQPVQLTFGSYRLTFHIEPYPEEGKDIADEEYRLLSSVEKLR